MRYTHITNRKGKGRKELVLHEWERKGKERKGEERKERKGKGGKS